MTFVTLITSISINLTATDAKTQNNALISQTTIFGFIIIALAVLLYMSGSTSLEESAAPVIKFKGYSWPSITLPTNTSSSLMAALLFIGIITSFVTTSIDLSTSDSKTKQNLVIAQAVIFSIVILGLALTATSVFGDDIMTKDLYIMAIVHAGLILSVVSLSANIMSKLASASSFATKHPLVTA